MNNSFLENKEHISSLNPSFSPFYRGVIYNNKDPQKLGRCQVRILGIHDEDETKINSDHLPWAELLVPLSIAGGNSGIGLSSVPTQGTWVWLFLEKGDWNRPVIIGIIEGKNTDKRKYPQGFRDKEDVYPLDDRLQESDINRLARNEKVSETIIITIRDKNRDKGITDNKGNTWDELEQKTTLAEYPYNTVQETQGGSFIEYDSTKGNERIHVLHKSGTYSEIQDNGNFQEKIVKDSRRIVNENDYHLIKGQRKTVVRDDVDEKFDKNIEVVVGKDKKETVKGKVVENYNQGQYTNGGLEIRIEAGMIYLN